MTEFLHDPKMGPLVWDNTCEWWKGSVDLESGSTFTLYVHTPSGIDQSITESARQVFAFMKDSETKVRRFAADNLLLTHNDNWSEGKPITLEEFMIRLIPEAIEIFSDGDAEMSFGDDDMFWGHSVGVRYRRGQFTEAVVQG